MARKIRTLNIGVKKPIKSAAPQIIKSSPISELHCDAFKLLSKYNPPCINAVMLIITLSNSNAAPDAAPGNVEKYLISLSLPDNFAL